MKEKNISKLSLKELRDNFYKCRNFEISNLWQRSIFLTAFLVLCFTGYGTIVKLLFKKDMNTAIILHFIAFFLSVVGLVIAIIWIFMAKSSKAWYEVYERAIVSIENKEELQIPEEYIMGCFLNRAKGEIDKSIFSTKPGPYSPSRLNILIGIVLFVVWFVIINIHTICIIQTIIPWITCICFRIILSIFINCMISFILKEILEHLAISSALE